MISKEVISNYFYSLEKSYSIPNRMELVKEWLLRELKRRVRQERAKSWVEEEVQFLEKEDYLEAFKKIQAKNRNKDDSFDDFEQEQKLLAEMVVKEKFKPLFAKVKKLKFIDIQGIYQHMFEQNFAAIEPESWKEIGRQTIENLNRMEIANEDATPYVYLQDLLEGRKSNTAIRHIFIDEAQDYTPFQFAFIQMLFPYSKMTLLGDFNQAIFSGATGSSTVLTELSLKEADTYVLTKTYRSTQEIVEFTRAMIEGGEKIEPFNRHGRKPVIQQIAASQQHQLILEKIKEFANDGHRTIAVICRTSADSRHIYDALKGNLPVHLIEKGTISYEKGILVIPSYLAKGIEFDAVIIADSSEYRKMSEKKLFYTVCTRAMHDLHLFATDGLSPLMEMVSNDTYVVE